MGLQTKNSYKTPVLTLMPMSVSGKELVYWGLSIFGGEKTVDFFVGSSSGGVGATNVMDGKRQPNDRLCLSPSVIILSIHAFRLTSTMHIHRAASIHSDDKHFFVLFFKIYN